MKLKKEQILLVLIKLKKSTREYLYDFLLQKLNYLELNINYMRGQGYDNGSYMSEKHIGLQKRILDNYP